MGLVNTVSIIRDYSPHVFILTGPTASGKTQLGLELAGRLGAEIVAVDSMTLYRGMDIGTAKPNLVERQGVPHHLLDVLNAWESASVAWWLERAAACCQQIRARGHNILFVGGTPLYVKTLLHGLFDGPPADPAVRDRLLQEASASGNGVLHARLAQVDPVAAARLHVNDLRRIVRALEVWEVTGRPISAWQAQWTASSAAEVEALLGNRCVWLDLPRAELYARIDARVERMFAQGLVEEARALRALPRPVSREASQALGYKEVFDLLDGRATLADAATRIQTRSRNFAKRQLTWFRHLPGCRPATRELTIRAWELTMT